MKNLAPRSAYTPPDEPQLSRTAVCKSAIICTVFAFTRPGTDTGSQSGNGKAEVKFLASDLFCKSCKGDGITAKTPPARNMEYRP